MHGLEAHHQVDVAVDDPGQEGQTREVDPLRVTGKCRRCGRAGCGDPSLIVCDKDSVGYRVGR